jgi:hypothetical protein
VPGARWTRAELDVLHDARALLAVAVAADRTAGDGWPEIGKALGESADTVAGRYQSGPPRRRHPADLTEGDCAPPRVHDLAQDGGEQAEACR